MMRTWMVILRETYEAMPEMPYVSSRAAVVILALLMMAVTGCASSHMGNAIAAPADLAIEVASTR